MNPETNLVVFCARIFLSDSELSSLRFALTAPLNWGLVEQTAQNHAIAPLVAYVLAQHGTGLIPEDTLKELRERLLRTAQKNLAWLHEWRRVLDSLADSLGYPGRSCEHLSAHRRWAAVSGAYDPSLSRPTLVGPHVYVDRLSLCE